MHGFPTSTTTWIHFLRQLEHERGYDFAFGVEVGFALYENVLNRLHFRTVLEPDFSKHRLNNLIASGIEYGELLAAQMREQDLCLLLDLQRAFRETVKA